MKKIFIVFIILQLFLIVSCKKKSLNDNSMTPNQLENHIKNGDNTYSINGEKVLDNETEDSKTYENCKESIENKNQTIKNKSSRLKTNEPTWIDKNGYEYTAEEIRKMRKNDPNHIYRTTGRPVH